MYYLGVDLGGTNIKAALVTESGEIVKEAVSLRTCRARGKKFVMTLSLCAVSLRKGSRWPALVSAAPAR